MRFRASRGDANGVCKQIWLAMRYGVHRESENDGNLLPRHHLRDGYPPSEDESSAMGGKVLLGVIGFGELLDVHG